MNLATRAAGYLSGFTFKFWLGAVALALAFAGVQTLRLAWANETIATMERDQAKAIASAVKKALEADRRADERRQADNERNDDASDARQDAIRDAGRTGLNCERLRRAHPDSPLPAACGRGSGD